MASIKKSPDLVKQDVLNIFELHSQLPEPLRGSHIYITGGTGFLGTWLLELIAGLNDEFDFKIRASIPCRSHERFAKRAPHLFKRKEFTFLQSDIRNLVELPHDISYIIHTAATSNKNKFSTQPTSSFENNVDSTMQILRLGLQLGSIQNITLLSSSSVYGKQPRDIDSITEDSYGGFGNPLDLNSIYAESKRACEAAAAAYLTEMKLPICVARPFSFVGPYQSLALPWAVTDFMQMAINGGPIKIMSDGNIVRSIMYASDFANWILHITAFAKPRSVYNVGSPEPVDIHSLAKMIRTQFEDEPRILINQGSNVYKGNVRLVPSVDKAYKELGLKITVPLETAIQRSMQWHLKTNKTKN